MIIPIDMGYVFRADSDPVEDSQALDVLLTAMVALNRTWLRRRKLRGDVVPTIYDRCRYARTQEWLPLPVLLRLGKGDCKSLATGRAAELIESGTPPISCVHRWIKRRDGGTDFHILLMRKDASGVPRAFEDPSKICGMLDE